MLILQKKNLPYESMHNIKMFAEEKSCEKGNISIQIFNLKTGAMPLSNYDNDYKVWDHTRLF